MGESLKFKSSGKDNVPLSDRDAFDILALCWFPLSTQSLKTARLVKNAQMETMLELGNDPVSGSLQIRPQDIAETFPGSASEQEIINKLSRLKSYDVYSLRNGLRQLGIDVDAKALELSGTMKENLDAYLIDFTHPLVLNIFGSATEDVNNTEGLLRSFRDPDIARVRERLSLISQKTGIPMEEIPGFLRTYSDLFLCVAYYRYSLDRIAPDIDRILSWLAKLTTQREVIASPVAAASCRKAAEAVRFLSSSIGDRLSLFNAGFELFWRDTNRESFEHLRHMIEDDYADMGATMCGLVVKVRAWSKAFPDNSSGAPAMRLKYLMVMLPGLERLRAMEEERGPAIHPENALLHPYQITDIAEKNGLHS